MAGILRGSGTFIGGVTEFQVIISHGGSLESGVFRIVIGFTEIDDGNFVVGDEIFDGFSISEKGGNFTGTFGDPGDDFGGSSTTVIFDFITVGEEFKGWETLNLKSFG